MSQAENTKQEQSPDKIREVALAFDKAIENKDIDSILSCFSDDCGIEILGKRLTGKEGVRKWAGWLYQNLEHVEFKPVVIMVEGDTFFEEFLLKARLSNGSEIKSKQAEVLIYENYKIKSLRLYFNPLDFAEAVVKDPVSKAVVNRIIKKSLDGLV